MKLKNNKSGFTLLEIIIVIIIVGVLASLALPRFFTTINYSRATEALNIMATAKRAIDRCALAAGATTATGTPVYNNCDSWAAIGMPDPSPDMSAFTTWVWTPYAAATEIIELQGCTEAACTNEITMSYVTTNGAQAVTRTGGGNFSNVQ